MQILQMCDHNISFKFFFATFAGTENKYIFSKLSNSTSESNCYFFYFSFSLKKERFNVSLLHIRLYILGYKTTVKLKFFHCCLSK